MVSTDINWSQQIGKKIDTNGYELHKHSNFIEQKFNLYDRDKKKYQYYFEYSDDVSLSNIKYSKEEYSGNGMIVYYNEVETNNINEYIDSLYKEYLSIYENISVLKGKINQSNNLLTYKFQLQRNNNDKLEYDELIILLLKTKNSYMTLNYFLIGQYFSDSEVKNYMTKFRKKENVDIDLCKIDADSYKCTFDFSNSKINTNLILKVDSNKYKYELAGNYILKNAYFIDKNNNKIIVDLNIMYDKWQAIDEVINDYVEEKNTDNNIENIKIEEKDLYKMSFSTTNQYNTNYIYKINDYIAVKILVSSNDNNTDEIVKDFLNFVIE